MKGRCMTPRRHVACSTRTLVRAIALVWLGVVASWNGAAAQVGYEPGHSPYHDIPRGAEELASLRPVRGWCARRRDREPAGAGHELPLRDQDHARPQRRGALVSGSALLRARRLPPGALEASLPAVLRGAEQHRP